MSQSVIRVNDEGRYQVGLTRNGIDFKPVGASFATPREAINFCNEAAGLPGRHPSPDLARERISTESRDEVVVPSEASGGASLSVGSCAGCGGPLPPGRHGQRRLTCSAACRERARYRRAHGQTEADEYAQASDLTPSRPSEAATPVPTASAAASAHRLLAPARDARPEPGSAGAIGDIPNLGLL